LEKDISKVLIDGVVVFGNGSILARKGVSNIVEMAHYFVKTVVASCGTWNYCGECPMSERELEELYGEQVLDQYDWIDNKLLTTIVI
jgi:translation initiation factor 2B subunit (eIF-2B alpha/beta/delta family)